MSILSRHRADFAVGLFVVVAVVGVVFIALRAANITDVAVDNGYRLRIYFNNIGGLIERAPVKSSGVRVGRVKSIAYDDDKHIAVVDVVIDSTFQFPSDSLFSIVSSNLLGGQYVAIDVGGEDVTLGEGDEVEGESAIVLEELIGKFLFEKAAE